MYTFSRLSGAAVRHIHFISLRLVTPIIFVNCTDYEGHPHTYTYNFLQPTVIACVLTSCIISIIIIIIIIINIITNSHPQSRLFPYRATLANELTISCRSKYRLWYLE